MIRLWFTVLAWPAFIRALLALLTFGIWTYLCLSPADSLSGANVINDKLAHAIANFGLLMSLVVARPRLPLAVFVAVVLIHSLSIEFIQYFLPDRFFSLADIAANIGGIIVALGLTSVLRQQTQIRNFGVN